MDENVRRNQHLPVYNIKAVARLVGLLPVTLRAWERRYGMPHPGRGEQGYRLYSEYDVRTLRWLKGQIETGLSIGRAVEYLTELKAVGYDPANEPITDTRVSPASANETPSLETLSSQLIECLLHYEETAAQEVMRRAFALYSIEQVLFQVIQPALILIGDAWHRGELPIAVEHYATQFCTQHLMGMLAAAAPPTRPGVIVAACAPGELHQVGLLMMVVLLRWRGWDIKFLGQNLPLEDLAEALHPIKPDILMFSATQTETAAALSQLPQVLEKMRPPLPLIVLGGQAFTYMRLPENVPAVYLPANPADMLLQFEELIMQSRQQKVQYQDFKRLE